MAGLVDLPAAGKDLEVSHGESVILRLFPGAAGETGVAVEVGLHPGDQLGGVERLCDVVVRPQTQPTDLVHRVGAGGDHEDGYIYLVPDAPAHVIAVAARKHQVQQDQVKGPGEGGGYRSLVVGDGLGLEPLDLQIVLLQHGDLQIVFHDQNVRHG